MVQNISEVIMEYKKHLQGMPFVPKSSYGHHPAHVIETMLSCTTVVLAAIMGPKFYSTSDLIFSHCVIQ